MTYRARLKSNPALKLHAACNSGDRCAECALEAKHAAARAWEECDAAGYHMRLHYVVAFGGYRYIAYSPTGRELCQHYHKSAAQRACIKHLQENTK